MTIVTSHRRAVLTVSTFIVLSIVLAAHPAYAQDAVASDQVFVIPQLWLPVISALVTNVLQALITKYNAESGVKALVGIVLVAVSTVLQNVVSNGGTVDMATIGSTAVITFLTHVATWVAITNPFHIPAKLAPNSGIG
jgi:hypothetical protein